MTTAERYNHRSVATVFNGRAYTMHHLPIYSSTTPEGQHAFPPIHPNITQRESCVASQELLGFRRGLGFQQPEERQPLMMESIDNDGQLSRSQYISQILCLNHDPFKLFSAEQEFKSQEIGPQRFYNYFVEPQGDLPKELIKPEHTVVYAATGHGKTTLKYHLEADIRAIDIKTLVITLKLDNNEVAKIAKNKHNSEWARSFMADLFIQTMEEFQQFAVQLQEDEIIEQFAHLLVATGWHREIKRYETKKDDWIKQTLAAWWPSWGRSSIQLVPLTETRQEFLGKLVEGIKKVKKAKGIDINAIFSLARRIGFEDIFFAVDTSGDLSTADGIPIWQEHIFPLVDANQVFLKAFVPTQYQKPIESYLTKNVSSLILSWSEQTLSQIITKRFEHGGGYTKSLAGHAQAGFASELDNLLIHASQKSPRRLLQLVNDLINAHLAGSPPTHELSRDDWACLEV